MQRTIDTTAAVYTELRKRGVRVLIGGDYGFAQSPQGDNARDLKHFVDLDAAHHRYDGCGLYRTPQARCACSHWGRLRIRSVTAGRQRPRPEAFCRSRCSAPSIRRLRSIPNSASEVCVFSLGETTDSLSHRRETTPAT